MRSLAIVLIALLAQPASATESVDLTVVADLRTRGRFEEAEAQGIKEWQRNDLSQAQRADLAIQLALTYTEHAFASPPETRDVLWRKAEDVCNAFVNRWPTNPRRPLVEVQRALVWLARGEQLRDEADGTGNSAPALAQAAEHFRAAARDLERLAKSIQELSLEAGRGSLANRSPDALSAAELESLRRHINFCFAKAQRQLGLCYPPQSADRDNSLLLAMEQLEPLAQQRTPDSIVWDARITLVACLRELGRTTEARKYLHDWNPDNRPPSVSPRLAAELILAHLADGNINEALKVSRRSVAAETPDKTALAELALAKLHVAVADWKRSQHADRKSDAAELIAYVKAIGREFGPRAERKAQLLVGSAVAASDTNEDAPSLLLAAEALYHSGSVDEALTNYDRASILLRTINPSQAFDAAMTAAAIERQAGRFASAAERYRKCATDYRDHPRAPQAHLLAILCVADILRESAPADQQALAAPYEQLLHDHIAHWPQDASTNEVRLWLGQLLATRGEWPEARDALAAVDQTSENFSSAAHLMLECYQRDLAASASSGETASARPRTLLAEATQRLQPMITGPNNQWPDGWTDIQREIALGLSRMHLNYTAGSTAYAERLLVAALRGTPTPTGGEERASLRDALQCLLIVALARNGKPAEALTTIPQLANTPPPQLFELLDSLHQAIQDGVAGDYDHQRGLGQVSLSVMRLIDTRTGELRPDETVKFNEYRAWALIAAGDRHAALASFGELVKQSPHDAGVREQYAQLLIRSNSPGELNDALLQWQQVEERSRRGEPRWRRARQARIDVLARLGQRENADKLLKLTQLLYPDWDASAKK